MEAITIAESKRLVTLVKVIHAGQKTFIEVGLALAEIRDSKLYKADHKTFDDFCHSEFGWQRQRAYELISAAEVTKSLPAECNQKITNENQAAALSKVEPASRAEVLEKAADAAKAEDKPLTARHIKAATPPPRDKVTWHKVTKDGTGLIVPKDALALWSRAHEAQEVLTYISIAKSKLVRSRDEKDLLFRAVNFNSAIASLEQAYADCKQAKPFAVCPTCQGKLAEQCTACGGAGLVSEFFWNTCVPEQTRNRREQIVKDQNEKAK